MTHPRTPRSILLLALLPLLSTSCVSAWIAGSAGHGRNSLLQRPCFKAQVLQDLGAPLSNPPETVAKPSAFRKPANTTETLVWKFHGRVAHTFDGAELATVNAITLGTSEAITLPLTLVSEGVELVGVTYLVAYFDGKGALLGYSGYRENGLEIPGSRSFPSLPSHQSARSVKTPHKVLQPSAVQPSEPQTSAEE